MIGRRAGCSIWVHVVFRVLAVGLWMKHDGETHKWRGEKAEHSPLRVRASGGLGFASFRFLASAPASHFILRRHYESTPFVLASSVHLRAC